MANPTINHGSEKRADSPEYMVPMDMSTWSQDSVPLFAPRQRWLNHTFNQARVDPVTSTPTPTTLNDGRSSTFHTVGRAVNQDGVGAAPNIGDQHPQQKPTPPGLQQLGFQMLTPIPIAVSNAPTQSPWVPPGLLPVLQMPLAISDVPTHFPWVPPGPLPVLPKVPTTSSAPGQGGYPPRHQDNQVGDGYRGKPVDRPSGPPNTDLIAQTRHVMTPNRTKAQATIGTGSSSTRTACKARAPTREPKPHCTSCASTHRLVKRIASHVNKVNDLLKQCRPMRCPPQDHVRVKGKDRPKVISACHRCPTLLRQAVGQAELLRYRAGQLAERMSRGH